MKPEDNNKDEYVIDNIIYKHSVLIAIGLAVMSWLILIGFGFATWHLFEGILY